MEQKRLKIMIPVEIEGDDLDKSLRSILLELAGDKDFYGGHNGFTPATSKQCALMDKHRIPYDSGTSKDDATRLISDFFDSKKTKGD